jgi:hypothetical protein
MVQQQLEALIEELKLQAAYSGRDPRTIDFNAPMYADLPSRAEFAVKGGLILDHVSRNRSHTYPNDGATNADMALQTVGVVLVLIPGCWAMDDPTRACDGYSGHARSFVNPTGTPEMVRGAIARNRLHELGHAFALLRDEYRSDNYKDCTAGTNDISSDPKYLGDGNYSLQVDSPCINAIPTGTPPNDPVTVDLNGDSRPYGAGFDMGCYENHNLPAAPTLTSFSPTSGGATTSVTITGTNFTDATAVNFGGTAASSFTVDSATQITAVVGSGSTGKVSVTTPGGTATSTSDFTYTAVPGGTYYVSISTGNDSNDGSAAHPWKTIHYAISQISAGASGTYVLHVALGTYNLTNGEADSQMVLIQKDVTIIGESGSAPIIDGTGATSWTKGLDITGTNVTVENLYFTGFSDTDEEGIRISSENGGTQQTEIRRCKLYGNNWGIRVNNAIGVIIRDSEFYQNTTHGIDVTWSSDVEIVGNKVYNNPQYGIRAQCKPEISRNLIYDNVYGIMVEANGTDDDSSPTIKNNVIYKTSSGAMSYGIYSLASNGSANPIIYHNTIDSGTISGIATEMTGGSSGPNISYNIITNFGQYGIQNIGTSPTINYNDVWNNAAGNYEGCTAGANDLDPPENPLYVTGSYSLQSTSPCIGTIPSGDPVTLDYPGFKRPRPGKTTKDMGAYEYVADETVNYTLPGGTGIATDYRIFTIPLNLGTGADMLTAMENVLGSYDPVHWRAFLYNGTSYNEFTTTQFASHTIKPGMGFWIITTYTDEIPFKGQPAPDGVDYVMDMEPGWYLIGLPWVDTSVLLSAIEVTDGINTYAISSASNNLTQRFLWDYTGDGPFSGYEKRSAVGFRLQNNKGYFFKVLSSTPIRMIIPNPARASLAHETPIDAPNHQPAANEDDESPPPPPGAEPIPDIKVNGQDGPVSVNAGGSISVSVSLDPGAWNGRNADWWVAAHTPFDYPLDWYTYVHPEGWRYGIHVCAQTSLYELLSTSPYNVLNTVLPSGDYIFYFAVDGNMDGETDATWLDYVEVSVKESE